MTEPRNDEVREAVRDHYGRAAESGAGCGTIAGCCGPGASSSLRLGYSAEDLAAVPEGADLGLGCGNPQALALLQPGETVLDLGSGAGFDCFLAARQVGANGRVIGVDMTAAMVAKARRNAQHVGAQNVEFRLGEIEHLPLADASVDVILSNCVINLAPDKQAVFDEAFRVLKPGGRLAIADVVATQPLPSELQRTLAALTGCVSGASATQALAAMLAQAGFVDVTITTKPESRVFIQDWMPGSGAENYITSATIEGRKPASAKACCGPSCCS